MSQLVTCNYCQAKAMVADESAGKSVKCPTCRQVFLAKAEQVPVPSLPPMTRAEPSRAAVYSASGPMQVICSHCRSKAQIGKEFAGRQVRCPKCRQAFQAIAEPDPAAQVIQPSQAAPATAPSSPAAVPALASRAEPTVRLAGAPIIVTCSHCQAKSRIGAEFVGRRVKCPKCGGIFAAPLEEEPFLAELAPVLESPEGQGRHDSFEVPKKRPRDRISRHYEEPEVARAPKLPEGISVTGEYLCPRCGDPVFRGANPGAAVAGGLIGALLGMAFGSFQCKKCGPIPRREFPPAVRARMTQGSLILGGIAVGALVLLIAVLVVIRLASNDPSTEPVAQQHPEGQEFDPHDKEKEFDKDKKWKVEPGQGPIDFAREVGDHLLQGQIQDGDFIDPEEGYFCKIYALRLEAGRTYSATVNSRDFVPFLRLKKSNGSFYAAKSENATVNMPFAGFPGTVHIVVSARAVNRIGAFTLHIRGTRPGEKEPVPVAEPLQLINLDLPSSEAVDRPLAGMKAEEGSIKVQRTPMRHTKVCWSPDGNAFFTLTAGVLRRVRWDGLMEERRLNLKRAPTSLSLSAEGLLLPMSDLDELWIVDPDSLQVRRRLPLPEHVIDVVSSPKLSHAFVQRQRKGEVGRIISLDLKAGKWLPPFQNGFDNTAVSPDGRFLLGYGSNGAVGLNRFKIDNGRLVPDQKSPSFAINHKSDFRTIVSPNGRYVCLPSEAGNGINALKAPERDSAFIFQLADLSKPIGAVPYGSAFRVMGLNDKSDLAYNVKEPDILRVFDFQGNNVTGYQLGTQAAALEMAVHSEGNKLLLACKEELIAVQLPARIFPDGPPKIDPIVKKDEPPKVERPVARPHKTIDSAAPSVAALVFTPDSKSLVTYGKNYLKRWDVESGEEKASKYLISSGVRAWAQALYSPDGKWLAFSDDHRALLLEAATFNFKAQLGKREMGKAMAFSPDGKVLAMDWPLRIMDSASGKVRKELPFYKPAQDVAFHHDGRYLLAIGYMNGDAKGSLFDVASGKEVKVLRPFPSEFVGGEPLHLSRNFQFVARPASLVAKVWDFAEAKGFDLWGKRTDVVNALAWAPDHHTLAGYWSSGDVKLWNAKEKQELVSFSADSGDREGSRSMVFSPDGTWLATERNGKVQIWNLEKLLGRKLDVPVPKPGNPLGLEISSAQIPCVVDTADLFSRVGLSLQQTGRRSSEEKR
jgi:WD40 repeat protein